MLSHWQTLPSNRDSQEALKDSQMMLLHRLKFLKLRQLVKLRLLPIDL